jgi:metal-responsive CopG/Arc/MetJ family transcriptional regulator
MERIAISLPSELLAKVDAHARRLGKKRSQFVRDALRARVEAHPQGEFASLSREEFKALLAEGYREKAARAGAEAEEWLPLVAEATERTWRWND